MIDHHHDDDRIRWETGDASGGTNGLGGSPARVGFSNGRGQPGTFFELTGSGQERRASRRRVAQPSSQQSPTRR